MYFIWVSLYRVLIGDTIFTSPTGDGTAILCGLPHEGLAACRAKGVPSFLSYFKTLSIGPARKTVPPTSRSAVKRSADWATCNPALSRSTCTVLKGWLCITCEEVLAILLWGHFQMREIYLGGRGSSDKKLPSHTWQKVWAITALTDTFWKLIMQRNLIQIKWEKRKA